MPTLLVELTNRCNLNCRHCYDDRHGGHEEIPMPVIEKITDHAAEQGFDTIVFTGGEPTLHPRFAKIVHRVCQAGYRFGFVSNGQNFTSIYPLITPFLDRLATITFSLDGATPASHNRLRGDGAYTNLLKAISICMVKAIPFTFNSVLTTFNIDEIEALSELARQLGSQGLRFGYLMATPAADAHGLALNPSRIRAAAERIDTVGRTLSFPIAMGPGFFTTKMFPCDPLKMTELTVTRSGHLALCCHLPDHGRSLLRRGTPLDLKHADFKAAFRTWQTAVQRYRSAKHAYFKAHGGDATEHLPCRFCQRSAESHDGLENDSDNPRARFVSPLNDYQEAVR